MRYPTIYRPAGTGRVRVGLPYQPGRANRDLLRSICGDRSRPQYDRDQKLFLVARAHLLPLMEGLAEKFGAIKYTFEYHKDTTCASACFEANVNTWPLCECGCKATNHGTQEPPVGGTFAGNTAAGDLYVIPGAIGIKTVWLRPDRSIQ